MEPLLLTLDEIANPEEVLAAFFQRYNLPAFRACLDEVRDTALFTYYEGIDLPNLILTLEDVKRLSEACLLIHRRNKLESHPS